MEEVGVKIDKLKFPLDFMVMEMEEDEWVRLFLRRPFMKITKVVINVDEWNAEIKDQDKVVTFSVFEVVQ